MRSTKHMPLARDRPFQEADSEAELSVRKTTCIGMWPTGRSRFRQNNRATWASNSHVAMKGWSRQETRGTCREAPERTRKPERSTGDHSGAGQNPPALLTKRQHRHLHRPGRGRAGIAKPNGNYPRKMQENATCCKPPGRNLTTGVQIWTDWPPESRYDGRTETPARQPECAPECGQHARACSR